MHFRMVFCCSLKPNTQLEVKQETQLGAGWMWDTVGGMHPHVTLTATHTPHAHGPWPMAHAKAKAHATSEYAVQVHHAMGIMLLLHPEHNAIAPPNQPTNRTPAAAQEPASEELDSCSSAARNLERGTFGLGSEERRLVSTGTPR